MNMKEMVYKKIFVIVSIASILFISLNSNLFSSFQTVLGTSISIFVFMFMFLEFTSNERITIFEKIRLDKEKKLKEKGNDMKLNKIENKINKLKRKAANKSVLNNKVFTSCENELTEDELKIELTAKLLGLQKHNSYIEEDGTPTNILPL